MPFLEILLPTGHKDKIEVNHNSLLISVLNEVCLKRNLNSDFCFLTHNKSKLDLSAKFGMSKLINNSKLELVSSPHSLIENTTVDVTLQLPLGQRITNTFAPNDSLWSILTMFSDRDQQHRSIIFPDGSQLTPVVFHSHDQITGEFCLKHSTLASLGLRGGRALFRFELKEVCQQEIDAANEAMSNRLARSALQNVANRDTEPEIVNPDLLKPSTETHIDVSPDISHNPNVFTKNERIPESDFSPFSVFQSDYGFLNEPPKKNPRPLQEKQSATLGELLGISFDKDDDYEMQMESQSFANFKFPEETLGKNLKDEESPRVHSSSTPENRENVFFYKKVTENVITQEEIPDSFFEVTEQDLVQILKSYRETAQSDAPLMSQALREQLRESQFSKYQRCLIQFSFQDAYILLSTFQPKEQVNDLYEYVKSFFQNFSTDFQLYTAPPKEILKNKSLTLIKSGLVPMAKIYVSVRAADLCFGDLESMISMDHESRTQELISKWIYKPENNETQAPVHAASTGVSGKTSHSSKKTGGIPKWFHK